MTTTVQITTTPAPQCSSVVIVVSEQAQKHVLRSFNPERDGVVAARVDASKVLCAALIQQMLDLRSDPSATDAQKRGASIAITQLELASMLVVKANFAEA